jgi:glycerate dehydrogenase
LRRIAGTKLGIIGLGRTGSRLAQRGRALGMDIIGYHPSRSPAEVFALGARPATLEELLAESDAVSLHAPGGLPGGALLKANELARMRPDAVLVNVARASLVDLDALATALNTGKLRAAYLDVWEKEPPDWRDQRLRARNLFLSPHAGWASTDSEQKLFVSVADSLCAALAGHEPNNRLV